jgi:peptide deformylase
MEILKINYVKSIPVNHWNQVKKEVAELLKFMNDNDATFNGRGCFALHHCQVSDKPFDFFIFDRKIVDDKFFPHQVVINPKIIEHDNIKVKVLEGCMSFPFRKEKYVERWWKIKVQYHTPVFPGIMKLITKDLDGMIGQAFQHECDHSQGQNIYFKQ